LAIMDRLHAAGFAILADKPWITDAADLPHLAAVMAGPPLAMDIMTGRHDGLARLRRRVIATPEIFGQLGAGQTEQPAIEIGSKHHLLKLANGQPLQRPAWYYDVRVQGDGLVDIQSHMCDQAQWIMEALDVVPNRPFDFATDVELLGAERWATPVDLALYRESTGATEFPSELAQAVKNDVLQLACNGRIDYRLRDIWVRQSAEWGPREAAGGGDIHHFVARGSKAELRVRHGAETAYRSELHLGLNDATGSAAALETVLTVWRREFPGLDLVPSDLGHRFILPTAMQPSHEAQFPIVLDEYLDQLESGQWRGEQAARIAMRYQLLAQAREIEGQTGDKSNS
jgi:hypothetical protein